MADPGAPTPNPRELRARGQDLMAQLGTLQQALVGEVDGLLQKLALADTRQREQQAQIDTLHRAEQSRLEAHQRAEQQWTKERAELQQRLAALAKDNEALQGYQLQWAAEREDHLKTEQQAAQRQGQLEQQLGELAAENDNLKELHSRVTEQAKNLATEWSTRKQALAGDLQRLRAELEQSGKTLDLSRQRERQWQEQVMKLQDELRRLREDAGRMTMTDEQSHHLLSQLNAIIGFAEILLDEPGSRASGQERVEFLHDIMDSGTHLADYVNQIRSGPREPDAAAETIAPAGPRAMAGTVLVAAVDEGVRERTQAFLSKGGYRVEFAASSEDALRMAGQLQPLAIMVDSDLPPKGAQELIDLLQHEPRTRDIPVVLTTGNRDDVLSLSIDRYDLLTKPINKQQLLQLMVKYDLLADRRRAIKMPASVLVIDDDPRNTRLVRAMLKPHAISVLEADGGSAGIRLALKNRPDLIILDLMMPDVDGFQVIAALRNDPSTSQIPILVYTAKHVTADDRRRLQDSIQAIVRKGELSKEQFLDLIYRRGERRAHRADAEDTAA